MRRTTIYLEPELELLLKRETLRRKRPAAELIREAVRSYLANDPPKAPSTPAHAAVLTRNDGAAEGRGSASADTRSRARRVARSLSRSSAVAPRYPRRMRSRTSGRVVRAPKARNRPSSFVLLER